MSTIGKTYCLGSLTGTIEFTWVIENFSTLITVNGRAYNSERFHQDGNKQNNSYWYMQIYPGGCSGDLKFISLYLFYEYPHENQLNVIYTVNIRNVEGETLCDETSAHDIFSNKKFGFVELIQRSTLLKKLKGNAMIITAKVNYSQSTIHNINSAKVIMDDLHAKLHEDFKALLFDKKSSDAVISVDGVDLPVHTIILSVRSKVLSAIFKQETIENTSRRVEITDFKVATVKSLLQFIYSSSVDDINIDLALDLLKAADKYDLGDLKDYCSNYLMARIDDENILQMLATVDLCNASRLRKDAIEYFCTEERKFEGDTSSLTRSPKLLMDILIRLKRI